MKVQLVLFTDQSNPEIQKVSQLVAYFNSVVDTFVRLARNRINLEDNIDGEKVRLSLKHGVAQTTAVTGSIFGITPMRVLSSQYGVAGFTWYYDTSGRAVVKLDFTEDPGEALQVDVYVWRS